MNTIYRITTREGCSLVEYSDYVSIIDYLWMKRYDMTLLRIVTDYTYDVPSRRVITFIVDVG